MTSMTLDPPLPNPLSPAVELVAGVDTHKNTHHVAILDLVGRPVADREFRADGRGYAQVIAFLRAHGLEDGKFLCVIPRLRYTPYWLIRHTPMTAEDDRVFVQGRSEGEGPGEARYANTYHLLFVIREGKVHTVREFFDPYEVEAYAAGFHRALD